MEQVFLKPVNCGSMGLEKGLFNLNYSFTAANLFMYSLSSSSDEWFFKSVTFEIFYDRQKFVYELVFISWSSSVECRRRRQDKCIEVNIFVKVKWKNVYLCMLRFAIWAKQTILVMFYASLFKRQNIKWMK